MTEISKELTDRFRQHAGVPTHVEAVVVTLRPGAPPAQLERAGMQVEHTIRARPIAAGKVDARTLEALSRLDGVVRIELDSAMRALGD